MIKEVLLFLWIFIFPICIIVCRYIINRNEISNLKNKDWQDLQSFRKLFIYITFLPIPWIWMLSEGARSPFSTAFICEVFWYDIFSALFLLIAMKWQLGILSLIFFPTHIKTLSDLLWDNLIPKEMVLFCVFTYPFASWLQFEYAAFMRKDKKNIEKRKN